MCIKGILWKMIAKLQFLLGFEITFGRKSGFRVTFRAQLESLACFSGVSVSGLKKMGRSVAACLQAQEMSSWWQAVVSSEFPSLSSAPAGGCWAAWMLQPCPWTWLVLGVRVLKTLLSTPSQALFITRNREVVFCCQQGSGFLSDCRWLQIGANCWFLQVWNGWVCCFKIRKYNCFTLLI